MVTNKVSKS
jgi:hypothetical protein